MKHLLVGLLYLVMNTTAIGQLVINELDADTPGIDDMEFVELLSETPNFPLDGYVLVFFNGSTAGNNSSYLAYDLDGFVTDVNGLLLIGSNSVSPMPQFSIPENTIQNGADAVAIYEGSAFNFPNGTVATTNNLIDVLVYGTADAEDIDLLDIFRADPNFADLQQINEGSSNNTNSIQRNEDGSYMVAAPTPRQLNDGSGIPVNGIQIEVAATQYSEGTSFNIVITTQENVSENLDFDIGLNNFFFNNADFSGNTSLSIPSGQNTTNTTITLVDDTLDEGDEVAVIRFVGLSSQFLPLNNNLEIRIIDNDFTVASFGVPTNPTFGLVTSTQPTGYYSSLLGNAGDELRQALQDLIADPNVVRAQTYADMIDLLKEADQNPANSNEMWLVYREEGRSKLDFQTSSNNFGKWNREHTFPRSRAGYFSIQEDGVADGIDIFWETSADSLRHGNSDAHALRAADGQENSARSNLHYGEYIGPVDNLGSFRGDVARSVLYMEIRYNGLQIVNGFPDEDGQLGDLATLLEWHRNDPPDDFEMNRNNVVYTWQRNRNPFIDQPELVEYIWGDQVGNVWDQLVTTHHPDLLNIQVYPNPTANRIHLKGLEGPAQVTIFSLNGQKLQTNQLLEDAAIELNLPSGNYQMTIHSEGKLQTLKLVVEK